MGKNIEREFKWDASKRGVFARFVQVLKQTCQRVDAGCALSITDTYIDNKYKDCSQHKIALRIRRSGGIYQATLKTRNALKEGLATRQEWTLPLPHVRSLKGALVTLEERQRWNGVKLEGLAARFAIKNHRYVYQVSYGACQCEAALDNYLTIAGGHQWRRKEIELELKKGSVKTFEKLIEKLTAQTGLPVAKISKVAGAEKWILNKFRHN